jgi:hypothetical protein
MRRLTRLWRAFESAPGLAAIRAQWQHDCGPDYPVLRPFLKPTQMIGASYPCPDCAIAGCTRDIDYGDDGVAAVCRNGWYRRPDIPLTTADTVLHQVDLAAFSQAAARVLGIRWQTPATLGPGAWGIGLSANEYGIERAVVLLVHTEQERFRCALSRLLADSGERFMLLSPTDRHKNLEIHEMLLRRKVPLHTLEASLGLDEQGRFIALRSGTFPLAAAEPQIKPTPLADRPQVVKDFTAQHKCKVKDIQVAAGADEADYYKWLHGKIPDHYSTCTAIERVLRIGIPRATKR